MFREGGLGATSADEGVTLAPGVQFVRNAPKEPLQKEPGPLQKEPGPPKKGRIGKNSSLVIPVPGLYIALYDLGTAARGRR